MPKEVTCCWLLLLAPGSMTRHDYLIIRLVPVYRWNENLGFEQNKIVPLWLFSSYLTFKFHSSPAVSKKIYICLTFSWKKMYLVAYIGKENKRIELQKLVWKVKFSHKINKSRYNQYIKTKSVELPFKTKNSNISFCFSNISCKQVVRIRQL